MFSQVLQSLKDRFWSTFTRSFIHQLLITSLISLAVFSSGHALASQGATPGDATPVVSSGVLAWGSITALFCTFVMGITAPGTPTPWNWNPQVRFFVALGATTLSGVMHSLTTGVSSQTAIVTSVGALLAAVLAHFSTPGAMQKVGALLLCGMLAASQSACGALFPGLTTGNPVADMTAAAQVATFTNGLIEGAWSLAYPEIPASQQAQASADFALAEATITMAIQADQDAIAAYEAGQGPTPNWAGLLTALENAVDAGVSLAEKYGSVLGSAKVKMMSPSQATNLAQVHAAQATLHKFRAP